MSFASILIIDDEPDNFDVIETLLPKQGYVLHYASSGIDAIESLDTIQPDVILLDVMMPDLDGITVCQQIKAMPRWKATPIIMVTALNSKEDLARCLKAGADDFIGKPVSSAELRARVHSMLRIKQQYDYIQSFSKLQRNTINLLGNHLQELRGNLVSNLPHEFNTPLNGLLGSLKLLLDHQQEISAVETRQFLEMCYESACRLEKLTQKFLNYLHLELVSSQTKVELEGQTPSTNLVSTISIEQLAKIQAQQAQRLPDLRCQIESVSLEVSDQYLRWIIDELLENAFKFSQPATPVTIIGQIQEGRFHLWVRDEGRGLSPQQIASIGAFMQFDRKTYEQQGAGLGLRIVQKVVNLYGGQLMLSSNLYQKGTEVHLTLPLEHSKQKREKSESSFPEELDTFILKFDNTET